MTAPVIDLARHRVEKSLLDWMREDHWKEDEERFDALARELFAFQFRSCAVYAEFCRARGIANGRVGHWSEIPALPAGAFKETPLRCFESTATVKIFRTSGTSTRARGELHLDTLELYEASLLPSITRFCFPDLAREGGRMAIHVLAPSPDEAADSSLSHMFGKTVDALGTPGSGFKIVDGELRTNALLVALERARDAAMPVAICGTAFAFVHLLDEIAARGSDLKLPKHSRIMETGGFKGRSREMKREELYAALEAAFGVPQSHIVNQYGMTELGSQFYDTVLFDESRGRDLPRLRGKASPPWTRVQILDPETRKPQPDGETGMIVIHDLANTGSVAAIETADLGRRLPERPELFEVLGRDSAAEQRGCSIAIDTLLQESDD